ncbi:release factor glutamine methyltransferase [Prosthecobacter fusiformis]|uniref:Release factor glutamine methyltransferase n=1 Tax=Prosthecobacter fusiformis TaxID=48464 RepID=A0A4R7SQ59_9BACT|nr:peptide chain release factor N(5)-glutamine methyltransferase [Prosthecobacter fusiformis]TDU81074.1 release factor glutamine methyltransferase [Prosthecobacter fusiformis]
MKPLLDTLRAGTGYLEKHSVDEARLNMEHLLAHVLGCRRLDLYLRFGEILQEVDLEKLRGLTKRRADGEPLQHLLGTVDFLGLELISDHRALIPRPETEYLCDLLIKRYGKSPPARVLDMATGSGCIGLTLASAWKDSQVILADISEEALDLARLNASRLGLERLQVLRSDLFEKISGTFDLVVSNLPYIPTGEIPSLSREVRRDPILALDGGADGLDMVRRFLADAPSRLAPGALIALEVGHDQGHLTASHASGLGYGAAEVKADLAGVERFVFADAPPVV